MVSLSFPLALPLVVTHSLYSPFFSNRIYLLT